MTSSGRFTDSDLQAGQTPEEPSVSSQQCQYLYKAFVHVDVFEPRQAETWCYLSYQTNYEIPQMGEYVII